MIQNSNPTDEELWREAYLTAILSPCRPFDSETQDYLTFSSLAEKYVAEYRKRFPRSQFTPGDAMKS